eukprot:scaffold33001_cov88-Phaeocystis_antarctica.AAC.1
MSSENSNTSRRVSRAGRSRGDQVKLITQELLRVAVSARCTGSKCSTCCAGPRHAVRSPGPARLCACGLRTQ